MERGYEREEKTDNDSTGDTSEPDEESVIQTHKLTISKSKTNSTAKGSKAVSRPLSLKRHESDKNVVERKQKETEVGYIPTLSEVRFEDIEYQARAGAHAKALELISTLKKKSAYDDRPLQVATAESLTAGLIFSTLVDVPWGGNHKYGCFSVYDTDAKRMLLGVKEPDVYTIECASQMAVGVLRNSNATLAIAVSGNAMSNQGIQKRDADEDELHRIGEVFIAVAGYGLKNDETGEPVIGVSAKVYNFCEEKYGGSDFADIWLKVVHQENELQKFLTDERHENIKQKIPRLIDGFNEFLLTSHIASFIRYQTVRQACKDATKFLEKYVLTVPEFIKRIDTNEARISEMTVINGDTGVNNLLIETERKDTLDIINVTNNNGLTRTTPDGTRLYYPEKNASRVLQKADSTEYHSD